MSIEAIDVNNDKKLDLITSSGNNPGVGIYLHIKKDKQWISKKLSTGDLGFGFISFYKTKPLQVIAPTKTNGIASIQYLDNKWRQKFIPYPKNTGKGKATACGDLDNDGANEIIVNFGAADNKQGLIYFKKTKTGWKSFNICGMKGNKFDNIILKDMDGDGDLDILTCEENRNSSTVPGLGVIWYENPYN